MPDKTVRVVFPLFDGAAALDFVAPHEAFSVVPGAHVTVASVDGRNINASGMVFSNLADLAEIERCDVLCIPGGFGTAKATAEDVQLLLEYTPEPPFATVHPDDAPAETTARLRKRIDAGLAADRVAAEQAVRRL